MNIFSPSTIWRLVKTKPSAETVVKTTLIILGAILTPITLIGGYLGYRRSLMRFTGAELGSATLFNGRVSVLSVFSAVVFALLSWSGIYMFVNVFSSAMDHADSLVSFHKSVMWLIVNGVFTAMIVGGYFFFKQRRARINFEKTRHGSARLGTVLDVPNNLRPDGIYIGGDLALNDMGHILTVGATRSGKGTNLIIPALLDAKNYQGSWVIIDPKGENAAITSDYQVGKGQLVYFLDP